MKGKSGKEIEHKFISKVDDVIKAMSAVSGDHYVNKSYINDNGDAIMYIVGEECNGGPINFGNLIDIKDSFYNNIERVMSDEVANYYKRLSK